MRRLITKTLGQNVRRGDDPDWPLNTWEGLEHKHGPMDQWSINFEEAVAAFERANKPKLDVDKIEEQLKKERKSNQKKG